MKVQLSNVRLSFPTLFEAKKVGDDGELKYSACFIIDPASANARTLSKAVDATAEEKWGAKAKAILAELKKKDRVCYHEGPKVNSSGEVYDGFEDMHHVNSSNKARPTVIDRDRSPLQAGDGKPYGGCYVNAILELWAQDHPKYGKRINATLSGVQFVRDGDAFVGGTPARAEDFDDLGVEEEGEEELA